MGRRLLYAGHGLGAFRQAPCGAAGGGCGKAQPTKSGRRKPEPPMPPSEPLRAAMLKKSVAAFPSLSIPDRKNERKV